MGWGGWKRYALIGTLVLAVLIVFAVLYGELPWWIDGTRLRSLEPKDQAGILGTDRGDVLKMVAGAGALVALVYTARKHALDRQAHTLSEQGQVTNRYTKAITQLASDKLSERIGGIYALERVMADSARDHPTVVEVLAAFVRRRAPLPEAASPNPDPPMAAAPVTQPRLERPEADVQAAMTVLARRPKRAEPFSIDLRRTALAWANLSGTRLDGAILTNKELAGVQTLSASQLAGAMLDDFTRLDESLAENAWVQARIEACRGFLTLGGPVPPPTPDPRR